MVKEDEYFLSEKIRQVLRIKKVNEELLEYLESSVRWIIHYCKKHDIPLPESDKIIDMANRIREIDSKLPRSDETLQADKSKRSDDKLPEPNIERYIRFRTAVKICLIQNEKCMFAFQKKRLVC
jgi:hypothetical protein